MIPRFSLRKLDFLVSGSLEGWPLSDHSEWLRGDPVASVNPEMFDPDDYVKTLNTEKLSTTEAAEAITCNSVAHMCMLVTRLYE